MEQEILGKVEYLLRSGIRNKRGGVYPWMVVAQLDTTKSEKTIQRRMLGMARQGKLIQLGMRSGYALSIN